MPGDFNSDFSSDFLLTVISNSTSGRSKQRRKTLVSFSAIANYGLDIQFETALEATYVEHVSFQVEAMGRKYEAVEFYVPLVFKIELRRS